VGGGEQVSNSSHFSEDLLAAVTNVHLTSYEFCSPVYPDERLLFGMQRTDKGN
jgi:hypothetical protein